MVGSRFCSIGLFACSFADSTVMTAVVLWKVSKSEIIRSFSSVSLQVPGFLRAQPPPSSEGASFQPHCQLPGDPAQRAHFRVSFLESCLVPIVLHWEQIEMESCVQGLLRACPCTAPVRAGWKRGQRGCRSSYSELWGRDAPSHCPKFRPRGRAVVPLTNQLCYVSSRKKDHSFE